MCKLVEGSGDVSALPTLAASRASSTTAKLAFSCSWSHSGAGTAWNIQRIFTLTGTADTIEIVDPPSHERMRALPADKRRHAEPGRR